METAAPLRIVVAPANDGPDLSVANQRLGDPELGAYLVQIGNSQERVPFLIGRNLLRLSTSVDIETKIDVLQEIRETMDIFQSPENLSQLPTLLPTLMELLASTSTAFSSKAPEHVGIFKPYIYAQCDILSDQDFSRLFSLRHRTNSDFDN